MADARRNLDVITIGRAGVDLYGQQVGGRLEDVQSFSKYLGGCPANIAVGTARLGLNSAIFTRVGDDHMGRFLLEEFGREGVSCDGVTKDPDRLTALVILGIRDKETFPLIFYRENCADMALAEQDVREDMIADSQSILITGTHMSTDSSRATSRKAVQLAKRHNTRIILDVDYRPVLWGLTAPSLGEERYVPDSAVTEVLQAFAPDCDLIVGTEEELHILGGSTDTFEAMRFIRTLSDATIVCKRGEQGCTVFTDKIPDSFDQGVSGEGFKVDVFNVLGAGDAFMSGFLRGWLRDQPLEECCRLANACGAIVVSRHGCAPAIPTLEELNWFLDNGSAFTALRKDAQLERLHWATTRGSQKNDLAVFAIDHRSQLEELAQECGVTSDRISKLKRLALHSLEALTPDGLELGILLDGRYGATALEDAADLPYWTGRAIERPGSRPLDFDTNMTVGGEMQEWSRTQVAKCLCFYHPDDAECLRDLQERRILDAYKAARESRREFLLEIICSKHGVVTTNTMSSIMQRIYDIGVYPDWWKLEPSSEEATWNNITRIIEANDPHCRGILLLGLAASADDILACFREAARFPIIRGFAVGRTIFQEPAKQWMMGDIDDAEVASRLRQNFLQLIDGWREARCAR
ncbi:5-dehydro-2-deoxygluconokinase [uncultured Hyphomonas sp.]|uniref:bifunctional 5-dehydro-2-deoxygluconokinase/5-dehydro-2- deoxyphosphogluconate aldolase n=1 Tax=uncultured Hyphomonas sp. TaxID=225298 RepID=UPI002AAA92AD|nr:5-dehydro-2-deoxygluconokinase [uncultured Hyphomonas sp.]